MRLISFLIALLNACLASLPSFAVLPLEEVAPFWLPAWLTPLLDWAWAGAGRGNPVAGNRRMRTAHFFFEDLGTCHADLALPNNGSSCSRKSLQEADCCRATESQASNCLAL